MKFCPKFIFVPIRAASEKFFLKRILALKNTNFTRLGIQKAQFRELGTTSLLSACYFKWWFFFLIASTFTALISIIIIEWV